MSQSDKQHLGLQDVVNRLREHYGEFYEEDYKTGRKEIIKFLRGELSLKRKEANTLMDILEENRSLRYLPPVELQEELFRDPERTAQLLTTPSPRDLSVLSSFRRSDGAHWLIGE